MSSVKNILSWNTAWFLLVSGMPREILSKKIIEYKYKVSMSNFIKVFSYYKHAIILYYFIKHVFPENINILNPKGPFHVFPLFFF